MTEARRMELPVEDQSISLPWHSAKEDRWFWVARVWGPNAAEMERSFLPRNRAIVSLTRVTVGDALEFCFPPDRRWASVSFNRKYATIEELSEDKLVLHIWPTHSRALRRSREMRTT